MTSSSAKSPPTAVSPNRLSQNQHLYSSPDPHRSTTTVEHHGAHQNPYFPAMPPSSTSPPPNPPRMQHSAGGDLDPSTAAPVAVPASNNYAGGDADDDEVRSNTLANSGPAYYQQDSAAAHHYPQPAPGTSKFTEEWDASRRGSSIIDGRSQTNINNMQRTASYSSQAGDDHLSLPSRGNTLKKKSSLRRNGSLRRSGSRRSMKAGSVRSLALQSTSDPDEAHSVFHCPVPTKGNPTEVLSTRFNSWRKILKDLISYYREIQNHYEAKAKSLNKLGNVANNISMPQGFLTSGGIDESMDILRTYHKNSIAEANKAKEIEEDVILALTGLRSDLHQKIKEIKSLSGDFKNSVDKEMDVTRKAVKTLQDTLGQSDVDPASTTGKQDPYLLRLAVDRQVERQIDEENYLHQAYLNLENSGRELESIVIGEIQKAYNAYAGILKRESDAAYTAIDELRIGPISMPKDHEWNYFVQKDDHFVDPDVPVRTAEQIHYPGQSHTSCQEIRAGLLERKSKYLKSYTAGWYVLSPTHLHEFKSADKAQAPVMSLYLPEQKLGSHSEEGGSSNKFILKGRQTGSMHRGHTWVFRAETYDTMMAWYEDIKSLTEKTPQERSEFVRGHVRSLSQSSRRSTSSDGALDDEDEEPFSADAIVPSERNSRQDLNRPQPGGRFPSDIQVNAQRGLQAPLSPSSMSSGFDNQDRDAAVVAGGMVAGSGLQQYSSSNEYSGRGSRDNSQPGYGNSGRVPMDGTQTNATTVSQQAQQDGVNPYTDQPIDRSQQQIQQPARYQQQPSNYYQQAYVMPVGDMQRSQSRQSQRSQRSQSGPRDSYQQGPTPPVMAPVMANSFQQTDPAQQQQDGPLETPGGNAQYGMWMNGGARQPSNMTQNQASPSESTSVGNMGDFSGSPAYIPSSTQRPAEGSADEKMASPSYTMNAAPGQNYCYNDSNSEVMMPVRENTSNIRPITNNMRTDSIPLHIPGQYPKSGTPAVEK